MNVRDMRYPFRIRFILNTLTFRMTVHGQATGTGFPAGDGLVLWYAHPHADISSFALAS
jgi:hypothetical protein